MLKVNPTWINGQQSLAKSYAFSNAHTHSFGKGTDREGESKREREGRRICITAAKTAAQKRSTPHRKIQPYRIVSHCEPKRTKANRTATIHSAIYANSIAKFSRTFGCVLWWLTRDASVGVRKGAEQRRERERERNGNRWQHVVRV